MADFIQAIVDGQKLVSGVIGIVYMGPPHYH
jgi:hypothetical protein